MHMFATQGLRRAAGLVVLSMLGACQAQTGAAAPAGAGAGNEEAALLARIQAGVGEANCSSDAQCRTLPIGEKACGGPERWMAWSTTSPKADQLPGWATELAALARQRNQRSGMLSNCQYMPDPGAVCRAQHCVMMVPVLAR